jgi:uncharacterized membrane protein (DUF485 family)
MKHFRKASTKSFVIIPLILSLLTFSTSCQQSIEKTDVSYSGEELFKGIFFMQGAASDKISLFTKVKKEFPFENDMNAMKQYNDIISEVMLVIKNESGDFLNQFKVAIESGDYFQVENILESGTKLLYASLFKSPTVAEYYQEALNLSQKINTDGLIGKDGNVNLEKMRQIDDLIRQKTENGQNLSSRTQACSLVAVCVVWIYLAAVQSAAVAVSVAGVVAVAAYAGAWIWTAVYVTKPKHKPNSSENRLQQEMLINEITLKFTGDE